MRSIRVIPCSWHSMHKLSIWSCSPRDSESASAVRRSASGGCGRTIGVKSVSVDSTAAAIGANPVSRPSVVLIVCEVMVKCDEGEKQAGGRLRARLDLAVAACSCDQTSRRTLRTPESLTRCLYRALPPVASSNADNTPTILPARLPAPPPMSDARPPSRSPAPPSSRKRSPPAHESAGDHHRDSRRRERHTDDDAAPWWEQDRNGPAPGAARPPDRDRGAYHDRDHRGGSPGGVGYPSRGGRAYEDREHDRRDSYGPPPGRGAYNARGGGDSFRGRGDGFRGRGDGRGRGRGRGGSEFNDGRGARGGYGPGPSHHSQGGRHNGDEAE